MFSSSVLATHAKVVGEAGELRVFNPFAPQALHRLRVRTGAAGRRVERLTRRPTYDFQLQAFAAAVAGGPAGPHPSRGRRAQHGPHRRHLPRGRHGTPPADGLTWTPISRWRGCASGVRRGPGGRGAAVGGHQTPRCGGAHPAQRAPPRRPARKGGRRHRGRDGAAGGARRASASPPPWPSTPSSAAELAGQAVDGRPDHGPAPGAGGSSWPTSRATAAMNGSAPTPSIRSRSRWPTRWRSWTSGAAGCSARRRRRPRHRRGAGRHRGQVLRRPGRDRAAQRRVRVHPVVEAVALDRRRRVRDHADAGTAGRPGLGVPAGRGLGLERRARSDARAAGRKGARRRRSRRAATTWSSIRPTCGSPSTSRSGTPPSSTGPWATRRPTPARRSPPSTSSDRCATAPTS